MTDARLQKVIKDMLESAGTPDSQILAAPQGADMELLEPIVLAIQQLEAGIMQMAHGQQSMGSALDVSRLTIYLLVNLLIEKEVLVREEWEDRYNTDVVEKMKELHKQIQEKFKEQEEALKKEAEDKARILVTESSDTEDTKDTEEDTSGVVLPSEREGSVIKFPAKDDEK